MTASCIRFEQQVQHLHALGARATAELLLAVAAELDGADVLDRLLVDYGRLSPEMVRAAGGDRFPKRAPRDVPHDLLRRAA